MPQVDVTVNGRAYPVACDTGQEERIRELARQVDAKVAAFARQFPQAGEARLLLLAALVLADELAETREAARNAAGGDDDAALATGIEALAARIEAVAARLESS